MLVYFDVCCLCRPFDDPEQKRVAEEIDALASLFARLQASEMEIVNSDPLEWELDRMKPGLRKDFARAIVSEADHYVEESAATEGRAKGYLASGIKPFDARHLACAVEAGAAYFCTCDDRFLKRARHVDTGSTAVYDPVTLFREIEK